jgi:hypothetical protein
MGQLLLSQKRHTRRRSSATPTLAGGSQGGRGRRARTHRGSGLDFGRHGGRRLLSLWRGVSSVGTPCWFAKKTMTESIIC